MKREIIVNAEELESRVAILEDGKLSELLVERDARIVGSIYKALVVSVLPGMDAAFADIGVEKNVFLCAEDVGFVSRDGVSVGGRPKNASIAQRLKEGQEVVVQIIRAQVGSKGARATTRLALPGRYLVLLLNDNRQVGISRKIEERKERERLRKLGEKIHPQGMNLIMRTEAEGHGRQELEADLKVLMELRDRLLSKGSQVKAPAVLHQDLTLTYQVIRDVFSEDVRSLVIDSKSAYDNAVELVQIIAPHLRKRIKRYRGKLPIFEKYGIEGEIDRLLRRRVWLPSGGYISIDQAEALTAIDVNTGRFTGSTALADTILRNNLEAAEEIARQLRLRDLGGIIVIDFIDMESAKHRQRVLHVLEDAVKRDRQKTKITHLSHLGLVEMTRKRRGESLMGILTESCPHCAGLGRVRNTLTVSMKIEREIRRLAVDAKPQAIVVRAAPRVAASLIGEGEQRVTSLEKSLGVAIYVRGSEKINVEEPEIIPINRTRVNSLVKVFTKGEEVVVEQVEGREPTSGDDLLYGWIDGYRLQIRSPITGKEPYTVILAATGHSLAVGQIKGVEIAEEEPKKRPRRRGGRGRSRIKEEREQVEPTEITIAAPEEEQTPVSAGEIILSEATQQARTKSRRKRGRGRKQPRMEAGGQQTIFKPKPQPTPPVVQTPPEPAVSPTETPPVPKRTGLLRRGARQLGRGRR